MRRSVTRSVGAVAVAIPARDEVARIEACVRALDAQRGAQIGHIVSCVNNRSDGTAEAARDRQLEENSEVLRRRRVAVAELPAQMARAEGLCRRLRLAAKAAEESGRHCPKAGWRQPRDG